MESKYLIDTNVIIEFLGGHLLENGNMLFSSLIPKISIITSIELLSWQSASADELKILSNFIDDCSVYALDNVIAQKAIEIRRKKRSKIGDAIIAATAIVHELILLTRNVKDFHTIHGLQLMNLHSR